MARRGSYTYAQGRSLDVFARHQLRIARDTLKMHDIGAAIMGGMTKAQAREIIRRYGGGETEIKRLENPTIPSRFVNALVRRLPNGQTQIRITQRKRRAR